MNVTVDHGHWQRREGRQASPTHTGALKKEGNIPTFKLSKWLFF
jgi:hypothetical protein